VVAYELFVIYASIAALKTGSINMARNRERAAHAACGATGLVAFALFFHAADNSFAESVSAMTYTQQIAARDDYDELVQRAVQVWLVLLGIMAVMWIRQRVLYRQFKTMFNERKIQAAAEEVREAMVFTGKRPAKTHQLLDLAKEANDGIARPLEPYVRT